MKKILIADDEESIRYTFESFLVDAGYSVDTAESLSTCLEKLENNSYDLLFLDVNLGSVNGIDFIQNLKNLQPECAIVVITGSLNSTLIAKSRSFGAVDYLVKPIYQQSLIYTVDRVINKKHVMHC